MTRQDAVGPADDRLTRTIFMTRILSIRFRAGYTRYGQNTLLLGQGSR